MRGRAALTRILSLLMLVALWALAARLTADATVLPAPGALIAPAWAEIASGELPYHLGRTFIRVFWAFALAMSLGAVLGFAMGRFPAMDRWLDAWLVVFLNLPALVLIVLCYLWIGLNETAAIVAVTLNKVPNVVAVVREGARALDPELDAMARVFRMSPATRLRHVLVPQLAPYLSAAGRSGLAIIWKIVLVVEFLGRSNGIGFKIHLFFQQFDVGMVLIYALSFIAVMLAVETFALQPWERRARRWRAP
ncbi:ABC transporter permease [Maritimibacter sp. 55A14]|uniref:ABC transporter permease n=1 Tax=Maritimibacter sp. 55A14 TaxID=2174844 RepID=UPI000D60D012|nr:ABC transporter permease [Maritimibacter sp. 55A14]PWE32547.1 ABC transporter permease [Maritimibacter sp. 55A14]